MIEKLHKIRQWLEIALVIAIAGFVVYFVFFKPSKVVTLPEGEVVKMLDNSSFLKSMDQKLKKIDDLHSKINDLESSVRQQSLHTVEKSIPEAIAERDIRRSVQRMIDAW